MISVDRSACLLGDEPMPSYLDAIPFVVPTLVLR
jgi:hypothetical protein